MREDKTPSRRIPDAALAALGAGEVAYVRRLNAEEFTEFFPEVTNMPPMAPDTKLWALLNADGQPIMLADSRAAAEANAFENNLLTVSVH